MADAFDSLILTALTRAAAEPEGLSLFVSKTSTGLFPATAPGRTAARRAIDEALISIQREGRPVRELAVITSKGMDRLIAEANPKPVLDDFVRVLESRESQVNALIVATREMTEQLAAMKRIVAAMLPKVLTGRISESNSGYTTETAEPIQHYRVEPSHETTAVLTKAHTALAESILTRLQTWSESVSEDCPLPILFRDLSCRASVGTFHDCLRELHAEGEIYLHPWTGPLYTLPEPALSLLVGHEVAYYASKRHS